MPSIISSGKRISTIQTIATLITRPKRPRVRKRKGRVINFKIGLIKKLINPRINPTQSRVFQEPANSTPSMNWLAKNSPKIPEIIVRRNLINTLFNVIKELLF